MGLTAVPVMAVPVSGPARLQIGIKRRRKKEEGEMGIIGDFNLTVR